MQGTSTYDREIREDNISTENGDKRKRYMMTNGQDNKRSKRTWETQNTRTRGKMYKRTEDQRTGEQCNKRTRGQ